MSDRPALGIERPRGEAALYAQIARDSASAVSAARRAAFDNYVAGVLGADVIATIDRDPDGLIRADSINDLRHPHTHTERPTMPRENVTITNAVEVKETVNRNGMRHVIVTIDARTKVDRTKVSPTWQPGDVVVVTYSGETPWDNSRTYTYVRGRMTWPSDGARTPKRDSEITNLFLAGKAKHVLRDGAPVSA